MKPHDPADPLRLHLHIDAYVRGSLGAEPDRYTEDFTEWVGYDPTLTGLALAERRDEWLRKGGGVRGRSISRAYHDWDAGFNFLSAELKRELCLVWAMCGKLYPFTKAENAEWKQAKKLRKDKEMETNKVTTPGKKKGKEKMLGSDINLESLGCLTITNSPLMNQNDDDDWSTSRTPNKNRRCKNRSGSPDFYNSLQGSTFTTPDKYQNMKPSFPDRSPALCASSSCESVKSRMDSTLTMYSLSHDDLESIPSPSSSSRFSKCDDTWHYSHDQTKDLDDDTDDIFGIDELTITPRVSVQTMTQQSPRLSAVSINSSTTNENLRDILTAFSQDSSETFLRFPAKSISTKQRKYLHISAENLGLQTRSFGDGTARFLVVSKGV
jgi:hypothetical protein